MIALVLIVSHRGHCEDPIAWSARERVQMGSLSLGKLGSPPPDPSNRFADSPEAAKLGERIFHDPRFSANGKVSCASCHRADYGFTDDLPLAVGIGEAPRRSMPVVGMAWQRWFFWDGRADSLWSQALEPLENPQEHGISRTRCAQLIVSHHADSYRKAIGALPDLDPSGLPSEARPSAPGDEASAAWSRLTETQRDQVTEIFVNTGKSLAAYVRTLKPGMTPFDHYVSALTTGREDGLRSLTPAQQRGLRVFIGRGSCINCHNGPLLSNGEFHHVGASDTIPAAPDLGRGAVIASLRDAEFGYFSRWSDADPERDGSHVRFLAADPARFRQAFKSPSLRGVADRPPYMHAGRFASLGEVLRHYRDVSGQGVVDEIFHSDLSDSDLVDLEAFLRTLSPSKGDSKGMPDPSVSDGTK